MKFILSIVFCFFFLFIHSQNYLDLVNLSYTNTPNNTFENSDSKTTIEEFALELNFPIKLNDKTVLLTSFYGNKTNLQLDFNTLNESLNVIGLGLGINKTFNEKWSGTFIVFPKLAADKLSFSGDNMQLGFLALITNKKFEANLNLPIIADANYKIGDRTWIGMKFDGLGTTYNLKNQSYTNTGAYVSKVSNELVSYFRFQMSKSIYLNTKIGYAISRNYEVYEINDKIDWALASIYFGDNRTQLNNRFKDGAIFKIELLYRLHF